MKWGLTDADIKKILVILSQKQEVQKAIIFGSRALGNYKPGSDIDLAIFGVNVTPKILAELSESFYESDLPYMVDLCDFATLSHLGLKQHIAQFGETFFQRDTT